ncbi:hypothetical protein [Gordonia mangrovi]|uniref:hypothetical protein n=1 Tax=Gordonia mangrovi TaxID=2665643 RepID=UPI00192646BD|nr:hypothetical protein [Gordonia mangrovi]UVF80938.1 hypothetical protein NWF22_13020 [Gordonia mangrovi]
MRTLGFGERRERKPVRRAARSRADAVRAPAPDSALSVDLGRIRQYAEASGDRNPIHMGNLTATTRGGA